MTKRTKKEGFTIIEVVLVLAIAGLIFLMVFIAWPALQRSQRDTQRRSDMARLATALAQYQSNNGGKLPPTGTDNSTTRWTTNSDYGKNGNFNDGSSCAKTSACGFIRDYLHSSSDTKNTFQDPNGKYYQIVFFENTNSIYENLNAQKTPEDLWIYVTYNAKCSGEDSAAATGANNYTIRYKLEGAGVYCIDNQ